MKSNHTPDHQRAACVARNVASRGTGTKYPYVKRNGRHEHRVVAEQEIGRALVAGEIVHHDDRNGKNNDPKNLIVTTQSDHIRIHHEEMLAARRARRAS